MKLINTDLNKVLNKLPRKVKDVLGAEKLFLAGGAILSILRDVEVKDYDFFGPDKGDMERIFNDLHNKIEGSYLISTKNAITLKSPNLPDMQAIHRWLYDDAQSVCDSFDFHLCSVVIWWNGRHWDSVISDQFYYDLGKGILTYKAPVRDEDSSGSLLRAYKYAAKGFKVPKKTVAQTVARFVKDVYSDKFNYDLEESISEELFEMMESHTTIARGNY